MTPSFEDVLKSRKIHFIPHVSTATLSTMRVGGTCRLLAVPQCLNELIFTVRIAHTLHVPFAVLGRGSNTLFRDGDLPLALISTARLDGLAFFGNTCTADCGGPLARLARGAATRGFADFDFAASIPGSVGGGLYMNAGAYRKELCPFAESITVYSPSEDKVKTYFNHELNYSYRKTPFQTNQEVILRANFNLQEFSTAKEIFARIKERAIERSQKQPLDMPNLGSIFVRQTADVPLSKRLDEMGFKGLRCGGAAVSEKHAGFIVNLGNATANDVLTLIDMIQNKLEKETGERPVPEICLLPKEP